MKDSTLQVHEPAYVLVTGARYLPARANVRCAAQHVAMPIMSILKFREENFRDQKSNHKIHENIMPRKFGAIR